MDDEDTVGAWWHQIELENRERFEEAVKRHERVNEESRRLLIELLKPEYTQREEGREMKVSQMVTSKYLRKEDFQDQDQVCTIKALKLENVGREDAPEERWCMYFRERDKAMVLNVTTIRVLEGAFGDESDDWVGKKVMVYVDPNVSFQGRVVGGLRLRPPKKQAAPAPAPVNNDFDDAEIPF